MRKQRSTQEARWMGAALAVGLTAALGSAAPALAQSSEPPQFGMVGLARFQDAVFNAVLTQPPDPAQPPNPNSPGCRVMLSFQNAMGETVLDRAGNEVKETFVLRGNVAAMLRLRSREILAGGERRKSIRPVVSEMDPCNCGGLALTLEFVALNGWTVLFDSAAVPRGDPNPPNPICPSPR